ncbi:MAG: hypothetical protein K8R63_09480 [Bacteroidales bacterium]|nr:hypothetical protein [Bacteroidales bacterium]
MKISIIIAVSFIYLSCTKDYQQDEQPPLELMIDTTEWYTSISSNGFYHISVKVQGRTNGKLLTIETYGDGLVGCKKVYPSEDGSYAADVEIAFSHRKIKGFHKYHTFITAYEFAKPPSEPVICNSGSGEKVRRKIESDTLTFSP